MANVTCENQSFCFCEKLTRFTIKNKSISFNVVSLVFSFILLVSLCFLLYKLYQVQKSQRKILPIYYAYAQIATLWFILTLVFLIIPTSNSPIVVVINGILYAGHGYLDNMLILLGFSEKVTPSTIKGSLMVCSFISIARGAFVITEKFKNGLVTCEDCPVTFIPMPSVFYLNIVWIAGYLIVLLLYAQQTYPSLQIRKSVLPWTIYQLCAYTIVSIGTGILMFLESNSSGYCLVMLAILIYTALYAPLMYRAFRNDSTNAMSLENRPLLSDFASLKAADDIKKIPFDKIVIERKIGTGGYGVVYAAKYAGTTVALKSINKGEKFEELVKEIALMSRLSHPNIVLFMGVCLRDFDYYIVTECVPRGSLFDILYRLKVDLDWKVLHNMALDTCKGMNYLHSQNPPIIHRDLKSPNLLVGNNWEIKICDFDILFLFKNLCNPSSQLRLARYFEDDKTMTKLGTAQWAAPEVLRDERYGTKADVYSFGIVLWEMAAKEEPYKGKNPVMVATMVVSEGRRLEIPNDCPLYWRTWIVKCWDEDEDIRPTFHELLQSFEVPIPIEDK